MNSQKELSTGAGWQQESARMNENLISQKLMNLIEHVEKSSVKTEPH